jgi:F-type H+-transporting ATPase subunit beta
MLRYLACHAHNQARDRAAQFVPQRLQQLTGTQRLCAERARKLQAFLSQPFFVAEEFTGIPAGHVSLAETLDGCEAIMAGHCDDLPVKALRFIGALDEAKR